MLVQLSLARGKVEGDVFVDPDPALAVFVDEDHFIADVKGAKTVIEALKAHE